MNVTLLLATLLVELVLGVCGFIAMHLREEMRRRKFFKRLPKWEQVPFAFGVDWYQRGSDAKGSNISFKAKKPLSRLK